jgi:hypothetical protein
MNRNIRMSFLTALLWGGFLLSPAAHAGPIVLDFPDVNPQDASFVYINGPYGNSGFALSSTGGFNSYGTGAGFFYAGESSLAAIQGSHVTLTRTDGGAFDLLAIDLARNFAFDPAPTVTFTGTLAGGGTVVESFTVSTPTGTAAFETFSYSGFTDLVSVEWDQPFDLAQGLHQFTDVTLQTVPEPPGWVMAGIGLCGISGMLVWRRYTFSSSKMA